MLARRTFAVARANVCTRRLSSSSMNLSLIFERLMSIPKGFGKFFPKSNKGGAKSTSKEIPHESGSKKTSQKKSSEKSDPEKNNFDGKPPDSRTLITLAATLASALAINAMLGSSTSREITWQEFNNELLQAGQVEKISISNNKNLAKVFLKGNIDVLALANSPLANSQQDQYSNSNDSSNFSTPSSFVPDGATTTSSRSDYPSQQKSGASSVAAGLGAPPRPSFSPYHIVIGSADNFEHKLETAQEEMRVPTRDRVPVVYSNDENWAGDLVKELLPTALLVGAYFFIMRGAGGGPGGNMFKNIMRNPVKKVNKELVTTKFADVAGCDAAKLEIMEFVEFLKDSKRFTDLGAKIPRGALLTGPPGTGKTLLAKATAGEANVPFFSVSGSDFVEMFVGMGSARVRDLFKEARANAPCIVFIDEIDAVGRQRGRGGGMGGNDERENTLNQLLVEMDGFESNSNIVVLAGTNRADILDNALTRPGRFDRQIQVDKPDIKGRKEVFEIHLKGINLDSEISTYSSRLAALTPGFSGADIANICNEAAIMAARKGKLKVDMKDFEAATDRVIGGHESSKIMSLDERRIVAFHEAGHAVAGWNLEHADPLLKVTIVPRGSGALGFAQYLPKEIFLRTEAQILDMVCMALAGRASEQVTFGRVTTGASDDLRRVTQIVYQMVQVYGMNSKIGQVAFPKEEGQWPQDRLYSDATAQMMDDEVRTIVEKAFERTLNLIKKHQHQVELVAQLLIDQETITNMDISRVLGARPFSAGAEYESYVNSGWATMASVVVEAPSEEKDKADAAASTLSEDIEARLGAAPVSEDDEKLEPPTKI